MSETCKYAISAYFAYLRIISKMHISRIFPHILAFFIANNIKTKNHDILFYILLLNK